MTTGTINYTASYFKCKTPTQIQGDPTNKSIKILKTELQANKSLVERNIGKEDHGYLGLVLSDVEYTLVPGTTPFVAPAYLQP